MLQIDLRGKKAFIAGIGDDKGFDRTNTVHVGHGVVDRHEMQTRPLDGGLGRGLTLEPAIHSDLLLSSSKV